MRRTSSRRGKKSGVLNGTQNYGENHHSSYERDDSTHAEIDACRKVARKHRDKIKKKNKKAYDLVVIRISKSGSNVGMSRLCERCVLAMNDLPNKTGIKIKKIYYSNESGELVKTSVSKMMNMNDHFMSSFYRNNGYTSCLPCIGNH
jgi:hypothetical protein